MKTDRRRSREFALQGLYQWQLAKGDPAAIVRQLAESKGFDKIDADYFRTLLEGTIAAAPELEKAIAPHLDREYARLSPVPGRTGATQWKLPCNSRISGTK